MTSKITKKDVKSAMISGLAIINDDKDFAPVMDYAEQNPKHLNCLLSLMATMYSIALSDVGMKREEFLLTVKDATKELFQEIFDESKDKKKRDMFDRLSKD